MSVKTLISALVLVFVALVALTPAAEACTKPPVQPPKIKIIFHEVCCDWNNPNDCYIRAWIIVRNYSVVGGGPGQFCACAFNKTPSIVAVEGFDVTLAGTNTPLAEMCFHEDGDTARSAGNLANGNFTGFLSNLSQALPTGTAVDLHFDVLLQQGTTPAQLANQLAGNGVIVTGEALASGAFAGGSHLDIVDSFGEIESCQDLRIDIEDRRDVLGIDLVPNAGEGLRITQAEPATPTSTCTVVAPAQPISP